MGAPFFHSPPACLLIMIGRGLVKSFVEDQLPPIGDTILSGLFLRVDLLSPQINKIIKIFSNEMGFT